jgi:hypothetical protein
MASKTNPVKVKEINEGEKIEFDQSGTKLTLDDQLMINVAKYQKGFPVHVDICMDADRNLCTGIADGLFYVAQIDIPETKYETTEATEDKEATTTIIPLDMADVTLTLWSIDQLTPAVEE